MRRRTLNPLGETEMEVLQHVWTLGTATVGDVHARILETREVAYTTVMTVMKKLASKGYLAYERAGNAYVYSAAKPPDEVRATILRGLLDKVFEGSRAALVQTLVRQEPLTEAEAQRLREIVDSIQPGTDDSPEAGDPEAESPDVA
ncbi:MAG: BlaI/MecI/CopY family transcriptional regulator [Bacteroidota bacterium]